MTLNEFYKGYITWADTGAGNADLQLFWDHGGSQVIVPTSYLYYPAYVGSSPIQVTVTCSTGFYASNIAGTPT